MWSPVLGDAGGPRPRPAPGGWARRSRASPTSWCSSTTAPATARRRPRRARRRRPAGAGGHLSRNFGHQTALTAGLDHARGDAVVMIDADLQDPPEVIPDDARPVARGRRRRLRRARAPRPGRRASSWRRRSLLPPVLAARADRAERNAGDFRLLDRRALDALLLDARAKPLPARDDRVGRVHPERRALRARPRFAGETKYTLAKMLRFSLDAISSFSHRAAAGRDRARASSSRSSRSSASRS